MKEERGGAVEGCRSGIGPGSIASSVDIAKWRPRELPTDNVHASAKKSWNTHRLGWRVGADFASAASAGVLVAPVITIIDRYEPLIILLTLLDPLADINQRDHRECLRPKFLDIECPLLPSRLTRQTSSLCLLETIRPHLRSLHRHLPNRKLHRHFILHSSQHVDHFHHSWYRQIRRNVLGKPFTLPLERYTFHSPL